MISQSTSPAEIWQPLHVALVHRVSRQRGDCHQLSGPADAAVGDQGDSSGHSVQQSNQGRSGFRVSGRLTD